MEQIISARQNLKKVEQNPPGSKRGKRKGATSFEGAEGSLLQRLLMRRRAYDSENSDEEEEEDSIDEEELLRESTNPILALIGRKIAALQQSRDDVAAEEGEWEETLSGGGNE